MSLDTVLASVIVIGAAFYLYRKFIRNSAKDGCPGGGCCGGKHHGADTKCCSAKE